MIFGQPVEGPRIVPFRQERLSTDKLANGRPGFRVTQRFDDPDAFHADGRLHAALDVGNFHCGDKVLAMATGWAIDGTDSAGGRYVIIDHGNGWHSRYWHLNDWSISGRTLVGQGQQLGIVGRTGLGNVCHLHLEVALNGRKRDLWPLLEQNAGLPRTDLPMEDEMAAWTELEHVRYIPLSRVTVQAGPLYKGPGREYDEHYTLAAPGTFVCTVQVNLPDGKGLWWLLSRPGQQGGFFAPGSAVLKSESVEATSIARARTALNSAAQATGTSVEVATAADEAVRTARASLG